MRGAGKAVNVLACYECNRRRGDEWKRWLNVVGYNVAVYENKLKREKNG